jgi:hypothetical protein
MDSNREQADKSSEPDLTIRASDIKIDPEKQAACEASYRRGLSHGLAFADELVSTSCALKDARRLVERAAHWALKFRDQRKYKGRPPLLDVIALKVSACRTGRQP